MVKNNILGRLQWRHVSTKFQYEVLIAYLVQVRAFWPFCGDETAAKVAVR